MKKYYLLEIVQSGSASVCIEADSEGDAKDKVRRLLEAGTCNTEMVQGWDEERITAVREYAHPDGLDTLQAAKNAEALAELAEEEAQQ